MYVTPNVAMATNQMRQIGPNQAATLAVPLDWTRNKLISTTSAIAISTDGVIASAKPGAVFKPSTADNTDIAGVMMASP